ncbi:hypothetical protein IFM89_007746 [Coptis chinensis]|uniref:BTB/POZ domain-containing protein n=1 Tax=Coptis chinensis TaxID=261450 RepID=A0A835IVM1_9MAGN|nr:hypothetical protein IFM89_007746 [Coptis chinensis]
MKELNDHVQVHINGEHSFLLNKRIMCKYSGKLMKMIKQENKNTYMKNRAVEVNEFPGGANGFELVSRFCYNNGRIQIAPTNISILYCSAIFLEMTEKISPCNLIQKTENFLEGLFYWSWADILIALKSCECLFSWAESFGLLHKLISSLIAKISQNSDFMLTPSSSSSPLSSSPEALESGFRLSFSSKATPSSGISSKPRSPSKAWWFDELTILSPKIIEKVIKTMGCYGTDNNSLILTKFLIHYLKSAAAKKRSGISSEYKLHSECYAGLADTAVHGVVLMGKT